MGITVKPSDLWYKYARKKETRDRPRFTGIPDDLPFDANNLYEVIPMFEAVMDAVDTRSEHVLRELEEILNRGVPGFLTRRDEVYDFLLGSIREVLREDW
ncbi:hypothetical protein Pcar_1358 [Syntrophotalea carbinolica DSM 2380]|uniref:Uncharacterized protein n=1 Tax=Syntrophotalea carbinolica (strain DSM 2380 / NBRC 103641 / GraBd1) TaxID=338963 RepID=Q3A4V1_SYNC1|nr:hypothetical protein [Syntrophotalea carbinolica]ABA88606.1 hypothetical protein Pcar_1358 [Syntrophotalea carbinolica DSM 2380]